MFFFFVDTAVGIGGLQNWDLVVGGQECSYKCAGRISSGPRGMAFLGCTEQGIARRAGMKFQPHALRIYMLTFS